MRTRVHSLIVLSVFALMLTCVQDVLATGSSYSRARVYLKEGSPSAAGKVYVGGGGKSASPGTYANCTSTTSAAATDQREGGSTTTTYHFWAQANAGYKFVGWYQLNSSNVYITAPNSTISGTTYRYTDLHYAKSITSSANPQGTDNVYADLDLYASFVKVIQMSFVVPDNGSFTVTNNGVAVSNYASFTVDGPVTLTASPAAGYRLKGWYTTTNGGVTKNYFAFNETIDANQFTSNVTIGADFSLDNGSALYWVKGTTNVYDNLATANTAAASSSSKTIVVVANGTVPAGTYTISSTVSLLIPFSTANDVITKPKVVHVGSTGAAPALSIYRSLSLSPGATINCSGKICVGGQLMSVNGGNFTSFPAGPAGVLDLSAGGTINLNSGAVLYAWGFVKGQDMDQGNNTVNVGQIIAKSGSTVWEDFQVGDWRGGTASSSIYSNRSSWKFFPFQSYTVQNIEAPITLQSGSTENCYINIFADGTTNEATFTLIGSSGLFNMGSGSSVKKRYDPTTDHVCYEMSGSTSLNQISITVAGMTMSSAEYNLPLTGNMHVSQTSGTMTISRNMTVHAGAVVEIKSGATATISSGIKVYVFDKDDWGRYCMYSNYYRTFKTVTKHFNRGDGTTNTLLEDAKIIVDGTLNVTGSLYTSTHGADICGNGGGRIVYSALPSSATMVQLTDLKDQNSVAVRCANMHNDNGTYTKAIASTTFHNVNGRWFKAADKDPKANHTYTFTYIKSGDVFGTGGTNGTTPAIWTNSKTGIETTMKWANVKADACDDWWVGTDDTYFYNYTKRSAWHQFIATGSTVGTGDGALTIYSGTDDKLYTKDECTWSELGSIDASCLYTVDGVKKALINNDFIEVEKNTADEAYHRKGAATTYYLCFSGCNWSPATKYAGKEKAYTVSGTHYIWYEDDWFAVSYDSGTGFFYSLNSANVKIYYDYIGGAWQIAEPVATVTEAGGESEPCYTIASAFAKASASTATNTTLQLLKNVSTAAALNYTGSRICTFDLNGHTLTGTVTSTITIDNASGTFVVIDNSVGATGKIQVTFSRSDNKVYGINVTKGHFMLNSGTIHVENTHASQGACGVIVKSGHKFSINGGRLEVTSIGESWGVYTESTTTSVVNINGGTVESATTSASAAASGIQSLGGTINVKGGTLTATTTTSTTSKGLNLANANSRATVSGGTINASAKSTVYGAYVTAGSTLDVTGGNITATATTTGTSRGVISYGTTTIGGGTVTATSATSDARGVFVYNNTTTINAGATIVANANSDARALYYGSGTPTAIVNGGTFSATTLSTTNAYGVYAEKGTGTINDGTFNVTAKTTGAYGMYVTTASTPRLTVNGGKFMVKNSNGSAAGTINNTGATLANFAIAGGYYNVAPNGTTNIAAGKLVKDLDATVEASLISAGYTKKVAGQEYTVTWKDHKGTTIKTEKVESGKVPVYTGETPNVSDAASTREWNGWSTATWNGGTSYVLPTALPPIAASDVTYYAHYNSIYAEVIANGTTTRYNSAQAAWTTAMGYTQATVRLLSNLGTEASIGNMTQLVFAPTNDNSIITLDLNGHSWTMGKNATADKNKDVFLHVNKAGCKLIVTDNSASGNGYLMNQWEYGGNLMCAKVEKGELILQSGGLKANNTAATNNTATVYVGTSGIFTMTGGTVESKKEGASVTGGTASCVYVYGTANISGGTIRATHTLNSAIGVYSLSNTASATLDDGLTVICTGKQQVYAVHGCGPLNVQGGTYSATATTSGAYGVYSRKSGDNIGNITVTGNPVFTVTAPSSAFGVQSDGGGVSASGVTATIEGGTFNVSATAGNSGMGVRGLSYGVVTVKGGTFTSSVTNGDAPQECKGAYANNNGTVNIEGGTFNVNPAKKYQNNECARCGTGADTRLNISGGTFNSTLCEYGVRSFGGETTITGNPHFSAIGGISAGTWASATGTAKITVDGGTFICTTGNAIVSNTHTNGDYTVTGDVTIWDGKFYTTGAPVNTSSPVGCLKIRGGYYSTYTASTISNLTKYVVAPSAAEAYPTTIEGKAYTYRVNTKYNVTWNVNGTTTTTTFNRNEIPSYGSTPTISDGNTYDFLGWTPEIAPVTEDVTYTANFKKWEAEVIEGEATSGTRYEHFTDAFEAAQNLSIATIKVLSNVYYGTSLTLNPEYVGGAQPLTIDLNNHIVNYTQKTATYALTINKVGCKLIIDDSSVAGGGQFGHRTEASALILKGIYVQNGELELAGGTIIAQNNCIDGKDGAGAYAVTGGGANSLFTMTGGVLLAKSRVDPRAYNSGGVGVFNATGGEIRVSTDYEESGTTKWAGTGYGVVLWNNGTFNMSGSASINVHTGTSAIGFYSYGSNAVVNISGGTITALSETGTSRPVYVNNYGTANISGGDFTANCVATGGYNIETVSCYQNGVVNITGGTFHSDVGSNCNGVRVFGGTVNISGDPYFVTKNGICVGDYASATTTANAIINGGTFVCPGYVLYSKQTTTGDKTVIGTTIVNGGYFKTTTSGNKICRTDSQTGRLVLNGGYYCETSGTTQKTNITTYKGATTTVSTLSPKATDSHSNSYDYQLLTDFDITWVAGDSYTKTEAIRSGTTPTNTEVTSFVRNDSTFYFTGWTPTPTAVAGDATYNAEGVYHEAKVKIGSGAWTFYDNFTDAWNVVNENTTNANCTIVVLNNITLDDYLIYRPAIANARTTFDLNNFTIKQNTTIHTLYVNKQDAKLTITDSSEDGEGCLYKKMSSSTTIHAAYVYRGELIMAGGKVYCENTLDDAAWHPAIGIMVSTDANSKLTVTGGMVESSAIIYAYAIQSYGIVNISDGHIKATVTKRTNARALSQISSTATITGGLFEAFATGAGQNVYTVIADASITKTTGETYQSTINISGGTFYAESPNSNVYTAYANATVLKVDGTVYTAHSTLNISGGSFTAKSTKSDAQQVFTALCSGALLFDDATPHNLSGESKAELNITGGTFHVDLKDGSTYNGNGNIESVRSSGTTNISGGTFTCDANKSMALRVFRGKTVISGNPVFNVNTATNARGISVADWIADTSCDKANNLAEVEVNGGTFNITATGDNVIGARASCSTSSGGYGMSGKITINGGEFICTGASSVNALYRDPDKSPTYGTATATLIVNGGKFKSQKGTPENVTGTSTNIYSGGSVRINATGGYFVTNTNLANHVSPTHEVFTLGDDDPMKAQGYNYEICEPRVAKVQTGSTVTYYTTVLTALNYAKTVAAPTITILKDAPLTARWVLSNAIDNWQGILDLNGKTVTGTGTTYGIVDVTKAGTKLTIRDSSAGKTGKLVHEETQTVIWGINVNNGAELRLESGTIYAKNTKADVTNTTVGVCTNSGTGGGIFTMTGGKVEAHAATKAQGLYLYGGGTANVSGGEIIAANDLDPESLGNDARGIMHTGTCALTINGTASISARAADGAYGLYEYNASHLVNIAGSANITANAATNAHAIYQNRAGTINISESAKMNATTTSANAFALRQYAANSIMNISGTPTITANGGSGAAYALHNGQATSTATITGGTFKVTSTGNAHGFYEYGATHTLDISGATTIGVKGATAYGIYQGKAGTINISGNVNLRDTSTMAPAYGIMLAAANGVLNISETPTIVANGGSDQAYAIYADATNTTTITGGTFNAISAVDAVGIYDNGASHTLDISGTTAITANGAPAYGILQNKAGTINVSGSTNIQATSTSTTSTGIATGIRQNVAKGILTISGTPTIATNSGYQAYTIYSLGANTHATISGGTFTSTTTVNSACITAYAVTSATMDISGGTFTASSVAGASNTSPIRTGNSATMNITGGTFNGSGFQAISIRGGTTTIDGGTFNANDIVRAMDWADASTIVGNLIINNGIFNATRYVFNISSITNSTPARYGSANITVNGGKFKTTGSSIIYFSATPAGATESSLAINGGYYNERSGSTFKNAIENYCVSPKHTILLTDAEKAVVGSDYAFKVVEAYTLAWATDGDALTGTYPSGIIEAGATITAPNTPTKTGYTFAAWTPAFSGTMPAANTTYTATWTPNTTTAYTVKHYQQNVAGDDYILFETENLTGTTDASVTPSVKSYTGFDAPATQTTAILPDGSLVIEYRYTRKSYDVTFNMQGHGSATAAQSIVYEGMVTEPAAPADADYIFGGWYKEPACTNAWDFSTDIVTAATTIYAKWTLVVASVTINSVTTPYTTIQDAFTAANGSATYEPTIKILQDIDGITSSLTYTGTKNATLDLNGHTVAGTVTKLLNVNTNAKFTIDDSSAEKLGKVSMITSQNDRVYALYITKGEVNLKAGTIYSKNTHTYSTAAENKNSAATAVYVKKSQTFIMDGGTVESESQYGSFAIYAYDTGTTTITINDGLVYGHTNANTTGVGIYTYANGLTVNGGRIIGHAWTTTAYGVYVRGASAGATLNGGVIEATNDTINNRGTTTTYGVFARGPVTIPSTSTVSVLAKSRTNNAYAVYVYDGVTGSTIEGGTFTAIAKTGNYAYGIYNVGGITVSGGNFNSTTATTYAYGIRSDRGTVTINGNPIFNVTAGTKTAYGAFAYGVIGGNGKNKYSGTININGGTFNITSTTTNAYGAYANIVSKTVTLVNPENAADTIAGTHYMPGIISITDGTFNVTATTTTAYGISVSGAQTETIAGVTTQRIPQATITGGHFNVKSNGDANATAFAMNNGAAATALVVQGGKYNRKALTASANIESKYTAPAKACNYHVLPLTGEEPYLYEVAEAYTITFKDGDNNTIQSGLWKRDVTPTYTGATPTKTEDASNTYTFNGTWSPAIVAVTADATYTAQFSTIAKYFGEEYRLDIIDYTANGDGQSIKINMNEYLVPTAKTQWTVQINDGTKFKNATATRVWDDEDHALTIPSLTLTAGENIILSTYDGVGDDATILSRLQYTVPEIITANKTITAAASDILYVRSGTLTINNNITVSRVYVCPGAKLVINAGKTLTVSDRLVLRTQTKQNERYNAPELLNNGTLTFTGSGKMYYSRIVSDKTQAYEIGFPYDVDLTKTTLTSGRDATLGLYYGILYYDSEARAANGIVEGNTNWKTLVGTTMNAKQAYQIITASNYYYEILFPVTYSNVSNNTTIRVTAYGDDNTPAPDRGWNYIVQPYTYTFNCNYTEPEENIKINRLDADNSSFYQDVATAIPPATPFYYQAKEDGQLYFDNSNFHMQMPARAPQARTKTQWIQLYLGQEAYDDTPLLDVTNIYFNPDKFTPNYDLGYDVIKLSKSGNRPLLWTSLDYGNLAFTALPDSLAEQLIPLTVFAHQTDDYRFFVEYNEFLDRLAQLWLYDKQNNSRTDLLTSDYVTTLEDNVTESRFYLQAVFRAPSVATDIENTNGNDDSQKALQPRKIIRDGKLYIIMPDGKTFNATGQKVTIQ